MLLQRLSEYAVRQPNIPPTMYQEQAIRYLIDLDDTGRFLGLIDTADPASRATRAGTRQLAPHTKRTVAIRPKLLADTGVYALGLPTAEARPERVRQQHAAFRALVEECASVAAEPAVQAVATFLNELNVDALHLPPDFDAGAHVTFRVDRVLPIDLPRVRDFWASRYESEEDGDGATERMRCLVCVQVRPVLQRHPLKIKGIPGGQTSGTDLISANARAFESYGLSNSLIAPTCQGCAERYGNALNDLIAGEGTHLRIGNVVYVFWTADEVGFNPARLLSEPDPTDVRELLGAARSGRRGAVEVEATAFYAIGLGASGSRTVVRDWIDTTIGEARRRLAMYFAAQELVEWDGAPGTPLAIRRLADATVRERSGDAPLPSVPESLLGFALGGTPLPRDLLFQAVRRNRAEQKVPRPRAALIKMVLVSQGDWEGGDDAMTELTIENREPAYLCGRLLAILESVQRQALGNPNATIVDKFYSTASSAPASVFGTLLHGAQAHLSRLRKERGATHTALQRRLEEVMAPIDAFPRTLTLQEQGLFALGYYHQRAEDRRAARERREANDAPDEETGEPVA